MSPAGDDTNCIFSPTQSLGLSIRLSVCLSVCLCVCRVRQSVQAFNVSSPGDIKSPSLSFKSSLSGDKRRTWTDHANYAFRLNHYYRKTSTKLRIPNKRRDLLPIQTCQSNRPYYQLYTILRNFCLNTWYWQTTLCFFSYRPTTQI